ncbi:MAG: GNAT family N-acetyltransferase [Pseudomonadota bacterium]
MFDAPCPSAPQPLQQSPEYVAALERLGAPPLVLPCGDVALVRKFGLTTVAMLPRARPEALTALRARRGWARRPVILSPDAPGLGRGVPLISPASIAEIDLSVGTAALHAGLKAKWRNRLRRAEEADLRIGRRDLTDRPDQWLFEAEAKTRAARRYRTWPFALTLAYARANPGRAPLFTAIHAGRPVAAMLFLRHGSNATYHMGQTSAEGRARHAHTALLWAAMRWFADRGVDTLDLGTVDTESALGLARFKLGTGARVRRLGGTWLDAPLLRPLAPLSRLDARLMQG